MVYIHHIIFKGDASHSKTDRRIGEIIQTTKARKCRKQIERLGEPRLFNWDI
jgi:hypothetical protein